jgi:hypothetical protein
MTPDRGANHGITADGINSHPRNQVPAIPRIPGSASACRGRPSSRTMRECRRGPPATARSWGGVAAPLILESRRPGANHLAHRVPRHMQLSHDLLDRLALHEKLAPDPRNRIHALHSPPPVLSQGRGVCQNHLSGGPISRRFEGETHPGSCLNVALFARTSSTIKSMAARTRAMPWRFACVTIQ